MNTKTISTYNSSGYSLNASLYDTLTITSTGTVGGSGLYASGSATVFNAGTIRSPSGSPGTGVAAFLKAGGSLTNTGKIDGSGDTAAVIIIGGAGYVTNSSIIETNSGDGVDLNTGTVTNLSGGSITGKVYGVYFTGASGQVTNGGDITGGYGVRMTGTVVNTGTILGTGAFGVVAFYGAVTNAAGGVIQGATYGVGTEGATILNAGTIAGDSAAGASGASGAGVLLAQSASVTNSGGGVITGYYGVVENNQGYAATVTNAGSIGGTNVADISLSGGGAVTNSAGGVISGNAHTGVEMFATGSVINAGSIGGAFGVDFYAYGVTTNLAGGQSRAASSG